MTKPKHNGGIAQIRTPSPHRKDGHHRTLVPRLQPGHYSCPSCQTAGPWCTGQSVRPRVYSSGAGHDYTWSHLIAHFECGECHYVWSENSS